jgi:predicted Zn-dependent protease
VTAASELQLGMEARSSANSLADMSIHYEEAIKHFQKAIELDPSLLDAQQYLERTLYDLGGCYWEQNRLPEAEQELKHAINVDPKSSDPRVLLVRVLMQESKKDEAESFVRQTKKDLPNNPVGYRMLGDFYFQDLRDFDKATSEFASLYSDHPKDIQVKETYVQLLILTNRLDEATKLDNEILKANPHDVEGLVYKARVQLCQKDASSAIDSLQSALRNDPDNALAHYYLGVAFCQHHNEARAESEWREALRLRPDMTGVVKSALACAAHCAPKH